MKKIGTRIKSISIYMLNLFQKNPHMALAILLFFVGAGLLYSKVSTISGALFGAGAALLGAWVTEFNSRRSHVEKKARRESEARMYLAPELNRTIERVLYIQQRAIPNFSCASISYSSGEQKAKPNDQQEDFIPYMPTLYPNVPQFRDLTGDDAVTLITFYDSLHVLDKFVREWWERDGQLPVNIFNMILTYTDENLSLAEACIKKFELEKLYPPKYQSHGSLSSKIER